MDPLALNLRRASSVRWLLALALGGFACTAPPPAASGLTQRPEHSDVRDRESVELTVYTSGFALVRERRRLHLHPARVA